MRGEEWKTENEGEGEGGALDCTGKDRIRIEEKEREVMIESGTAESCLDERERERERMEEKGEEENGEGLRVVFGGSISASALLLPLHLP